MPGESDSRVTASVPTRFQGCIVSASVILATSTNKSSTIEYLITQRSENHPTLAGTVCFPGGTASAADYSSQWRDLFQAHGINLLGVELFHPSAHCPPIYARKWEDTSQLPDKVALRITAIRETFEECGILLCKRSDSSLRHELITYRKEMENWQLRVRGDPHQFLTLCEHFSCIPDLWLLQEWNNWATPTFFQPRFDTIFYIAVLPQPVAVNTDPTEVEYAKWVSARSAIDSHFNGDIFLPTPQFYELMRLKNVTVITELGALITLRRKFGIEQYCAHYFATDDGFILCLPGDELFEKAGTDDEMLPHPLPQSLSTLGDDGHRFHRIHTEGFRPTQLKYNLHFRYGQCYGLPKSQM